jgi:hypothetical protein
MMQALILLIVEFRVGLLNHLSIASRSACQDAGPLSLHLPWLWANSNSPTPRSLPAPPLIEGCGLILITTPPESRPATPTTNEVVG